MHTATQLNADLFSVTVDGAPASREDVLPEWHKWDRIGVLVMEPFGLLGASNLIQLGITSFYDACPERRDGDSAQYPDIYAFHVGGRYGDFSSFDFWPDRKEVFTDGDPWELVARLNDYAITRLIVPDGPRVSVEHRVKEIPALSGRLTSTFAYNASGRTENADVTIAAKSMRAEMNTRNTLDPFGVLDRADRSARVEPHDPRWPSIAASRIQEVDEVTRAAVRERRAELVSDGHTVESYRRIPVEEAITRLVRAT